MKVAKPNKTNDFSESLLPGLSGKKETSCISWEQGIFFGLILLNKGSTTLNRLNGKRRDKFLRTKKLINGEQGGKSENFPTHKGNMNSTCETL